MIDISPRSVFEKYFLPDVRSGLRDWCAKLGCSGLRRLNLVHPSRKVGCASGVNDFSKTLWACSEIKNVL